MCINFATCPQEAPKCLIFTDKVISSSGNVENVQEPRPFHGSEGPWDTLPCLLKRLNLLQSQLCLVVHKMSRSE